MLDKTDIGEIAGSDFIFVYTKDKDFQDDYGIYGKLVSYGPTSIVISRETSHSLKKWVIPLDQIVGIKCDQIVQKSPYQDEIIEKLDKVKENEN